MPPSETSSSVAVNVETEGWRRPGSARRAGRRGTGTGEHDDDDDDAFGTDRPRETAVIILSDETPSAAARAKSAASGGVRVDASVEDAFGVRIPGSSDAGEGREGLVAAARRFGGEAQREAWRSRLEVPLADDKSLANQREDLQQHAAFLDRFHDTHLDVQTYAQTTSKYINRSYYDNRVEPQTRFPDGTFNPTPVRVANWIFAEEFAQRDGFVEDETTTEEEEETEEDAEEEDEEEAPATCFGCFARSKSRGAVRSASASETNDASTRERKQEEEVEEDASQSSPLERARERLEVCEEELAHAELNCRQMLLDLKRLARSLADTFTPEMRRNDPRAKELQEEIKSLEDSLKRLLDVRDEKRAEAAARRREIAEYERWQKSMKEQQAVSVAETLNDEITITEAMASRKDPLEGFGMVGSLTSCMFLVLAPMYLWRYYEWIQCNRVTKRRLKSRTTTLTVYFYNPLFVPGARRLRLAASNVELTSMVLAVQSLLSFQLWITDQSDEIRPTLIAVYEYILLNTFARVAVPCSNATILALRWRKKRGRETSVRKLWRGSSKPVGASRRHLTDGGVAGGVSRESLDGFADRDGESDYDAALLDERSRHSEEIIDAASRVDDDDFKDALKDLDPAARKEALRVRIKNEMVQGRGRFYDKDGASDAHRDGASPYDDGARDARRDGASYSRMGETDDFSDFLTRSTQRFVSPESREYEMLRREYVRKARALRKAEEAEANRNKPAFDVSTLVNQFNANFGVSLNLSLQAEASAEETKVESRLDVDQAESVLNAVSKLSQKHKKRFAGRTGYLPNKANARDVDASTLAKPVEDDDEV